MPVETIECQIVQAQLGRYLSGESFSSEMVGQLEAHIANCEICRGEVARRRASLQMLLGASTPTTAPVNDSAHLIELLRKKDPSKKTETPTHAVVEQMESPAFSSPPVKPAMAKPLLYAGALAIVLIGMSYLTKGPTSLFGDRALSAGAAAPTNQPPATKPIEEPVTPTAKPAPTTIAESDPISEADWTKLGLDSLIPFDATAPMNKDDAFQLALAVPDDADVTADTEGTTTGLTANEPISTPIEEKPAPRKDVTPRIAASTPAPATPIIRHSTVRRPRLVSRKPHVPKTGAVVRVYDPN